MRSFKLLVLAAVLPVATGCASIFAGGSPGLQVDVDNQKVPGLTVTVTGISNGDRFVSHDSVYRVQIQRNSDYEVDVTAPGFESEHIDIGRTVNPVTFVNILFWPGFLIDLADGAFWQPNREVVNIHLDRQQSDLGTVRLSLGVDVPAIGFHRTVDLPRNRP